VAIFGICWAATSEQPEFDQNPSWERILRGHVSKGVFNIDLRLQPFETADCQEIRALLLGKVWNIMPSISLKIENRIARKEPFQNLYLVERPGRGDPALDFCAVHV
jgi:hypothetical protein